MVTHSQFYFAYGAVIDQPTYERMLARMRLTNPRPYENIDLEDAEDWEIRNFILEQFASDVETFFPSRVSCICKGENFFIMVKRLFSRMILDGGSGPSRFRKVTPQELEAVAQEDEVKACVASAVEHLGLKKEDFGWVLYECC